MTDDSREALNIAQELRAAEALAAPSPHSEGKEHSLHREGLLLDAAKAIEALSTRPETAGTFRAVDVEAIARKAYRMFNHPMVSGYTERAWLRDFGAYLRQALAGAAPGSEWQEYAGSIVKAYPGWKVWVSPDGLLYHAPIGFRPPLTAAPQGDE